MLWFKSCWLCSKFSLVPRPLIQHVYRLQCLFGSGTETTQNYAGIILSNILQWQQYICFY